ncbi:hypothetical protein [Blastomonas aquatica]|nr:hypothetical protein [Blastomonas aquatica]
MRRANPEAAYRARPTDPGAVAGAMTDRMVARNQFNASADDASNARAGLRQDPLNRVLLRTLGVHEEVNGRTPAAFGSMQLAHRVSRRDSITELWLAEYHRRQDNPVKALVHYDAAMLVRPDLQKVLFPQMVPALASAKFRAAVRPYIVRGASWTPSFVGTAAGANLDNAASLVRPVLADMAGGVFDQAFSSIVYRLAARGDGAQALAIAREAFAGLDQNAFQRAGWSKVNLDSRMGPLAWKFNQSVDVSSSLDRQGNLTIVVSPFAAGSAAQRTFMVTPSARYQFSYKLRSAAGQQSAQLRWKAECVNETASTTLGEFPSQLQPGQAASGALIDIPAGCYLMRLIANVAGPDAQTASEISIASLRLDRLT